MGVPTMRAAVLHGKEDVRVERIPVPELGPGEVLLRNEVALTCGTDVKVFRRGYHARMIVPPAVFGHEVAGVVEDVGEGAQGVRKGMAVVVANSAPCGECHYCRRDRPNLCDDLIFWNGAYAEFARIPARIVQKNLIPLSAGISFRQAAMVEPLACAVRGVDESGIREGQSVAVIGTGPIGLMLIALARLRGSSVLAAGRRESRLQKALELGAESTLTAGEGKDLAELLRRASPDGQGHDVVLEAVGHPDTCEAALRAVRKGGLVNLFAGCPAGSRITVDPERLHYEELTLKSTFHHTPQSVRTAFRLVAQGAVQPDAFITAEEPLERLPEVLRTWAAGGEGLKTAILPGQRWAGKN